MLLPASEALLDEESDQALPHAAIARSFGATATGDPLYQAISDGRRLAGMEHWLPLFEERLATLFEHLARRRRDRPRRAASPARPSTRFEAIADYHANRVQARSRRDRPAAIARSRPISSI